MPFHFCPQELMVIMTAIPFIAVVIARAKTYLSCKFCKNNSCEQNESTKTSSEQISQEK